MLKKCQKKTVFFWPDAFLKKISGRLALVTICGIFRSVSLWGVIYWILCHVVSIKNLPSASVLYILVLLHKNGSNDSHKYHCRWSPGNNNYKYNIHNTNEICIWYSNVKIWGGKIKKMIQYNSGMFHLNAKQQSCFDS